MTNQRIRAVFAALTAIAIWAAAASPALAEPTKCKRDTAKAAAKYVQARSKILAKCEQSKIGGKFTPATNCLTDPDTLEDLNAAEAKFTAAVDKSCGGTDKLCSTPAGNDTPASLGWPSQCPNFEGGSCNNAIMNCGDIATCVSCIVRNAVNQANTVIHDDLSLPTVKGSALNKCQAALSKETNKFMAAKSKALQGCWDSRLQAKHTAVCPDGTISDTKSPARKAFDAIAKAETKKVAAICKACGGADKECGGGDDLAVAAIGFGATCPMVDVPQGELCGDIATNTVQGIVDCVDCVAEYKIDCSDRAAVQAALPAPGATTENLPYPADCGNPTFGPTCSQLQVTVATSYTPPGGGDFVLGIGVKLDYNQARLSLPGIGAFDPPTTAARLMDLTPTPGDNSISGGDANDSVATVGILDASAPGVEAGNFARITFDCVPGKASPGASSFTCVADVGTFLGETIPGTCSVVSVNPIP